MDSQSATNASSFNIECGVVIIESRLITKNPKIDYKASEDAKQLYDYYQIKLDSAQLYIANHKANIGDSAVAAKKLDQKFLRNFSFYIRFYSIVEPANLKFPQFKVCALIGALDVVLTDQSIIALANLCNSTQYELKKFLDKAKIYKEKFDVTIAQSSSDQGSETGSEIGGGDETVPAKSEAGSDWGFMLEQEKSDSASLKGAEESKKGEEFIAPPTKPKFEMMVLLNRINIELGKVNTSFFKIISF